MMSLRKIFKILEDQSGMQDSHPSNTLGKLVWGNGQSVSILDVAVSCSPHHIGPRSHIIENIVLGSKKFVVNNFNRNFTEVIITKN